MQHDRNMGHFFQFGHWEQKLEQSACLLAVFALCEAQSATE